MTAGESLSYVVALWAVTAASGWAAYRLGDLALAAGAGVVGAYALHLLSLRRARSRCRHARILDRLGSELGGTVTTETIVIRRFTLATVALIEDLMEVEDVVRTLVSTARDPAKGFGARAIEKGHLTAGEVKALTDVRREARFLTDQVRAARRKLQEFRRENGAPAV